MKLQDFLSYLRAIADHRSDIEQFYEATSAEILDFYQTDLDYPVMWVEIPDMSIDNDADYPVIRYRGTIAILNNHDQRNPDEVPILLNSALDTTLGIVAQIQHDIERGSHYGTLRRKDMIPITSDMVDSAIGFQLAYELEYPLDLSAYCDQVTDID